MNNQNPIKSLLIILGVVMVLGGAWYGWEKWSAYRIAHKPMNLEVNYTPQVEGVVKAPEGMPNDLPVETENVLESITTRFPDQNAVQSTYTYRSSASLETKATQYRDYLNQAGYTVKESGGNGLVTLEGSKEGSKFIIVLSVWENLTTVQIGHLSF